MTSRNVLIYRLGSLGDTVMALPAFHLVRRAFPSARLSLLTNRPVATKAAPLAAVLGSGLFFDDVIDYPVGVRDPRVIFRLAREIRRRRIDTVVSLAAPRSPRADQRDRLFFRVAGASRLIGFPSPADRAPALDPQTGLFPWEAERLLRRLTALGVPDLREPGWWDLRLTEEEQAAGESARRAVTGRSFLAVSVGTKMPAKDWGQENWKSLLASARMPLGDFGLLFVGAAEERERSTACAEGWPGPVVNLCGVASPRVSAAAMRGAAAFVGHDSGPMHLAATVGVPVVAVFSARSLPGQWYPRGANNRILYRQTDCFGCGLEVCVEQKKRCLLTISPAEVLDALLAVLGQRSLRDG